MFFYITLHEIETSSVRDHRFDPFNRKAELYQTWHLAEIEPVDSGDDESFWARQGFSVRGAPYSGTQFRSEESRTVVDPQITFAVPQTTFDRDRLTLQFDLHFWESDRRRDTQKVRALFADQTLDYLTDAFDKLGKDDKAARKALNQWIDSNWKDIVTGLVGAAAPAAAGVMSNYNLLPLLEILVKMAAAEGDDYHGMQRYLIDFERTDNDDDSFRWRAYTPSAEGKWRRGTGKEALKTRMSDASGKTSYATELRVRVVD